MPCKCEKVMGVGDLRVILDRVVCCGKEDEYLDQREAGRPV